MATGNEGDFLGSPLTLTGLSAGPFAGAVNGEIVVVIIAVDGECNVTNGG